MRLAIVALAAGFMLLPAAQAAYASGAPSAQNVTATDFSAAKKKKAKKKKAEKVEYMRAVPVK